MSQLDPLLEFFVLCNKILFIRMQNPQNGQQDKSENGQEKEHHIAAQRRYNLAFGPL